MRKRKGVRERGNHTHTKKNGVIKTDVIGRGDDPNRQELSPERRRKMN